MVFLAERLQEVKLKIGMYYKDFPRPLFALNNSQERQAKPRGKTPCNDTKHCAEELLHMWHCIEEQSELGQNVSEPI